MSQAKNGHPIALVDDDTDMLQLIADFLESKGRKTLAFSDPLEALRFFESNRDSPEVLAVDAVVSDIQMPGMSGNELLVNLNRLGLELPVIFATAFGSVDSAIESMRQGAFDYIVKPFRLGDLEVKISKAAKLRQAWRDNLELRRTIAQGGEFEGLIGRSHSMRALFSIIERVAPTNASVLVQGETGTGKELVARALHARSRQAAESFVSINCAAKPDSFLETELLRYFEKTTPTSPPPETGSREASGRGTLFLDEVGELSPPLQTKLLQLLEANEIDAASAPLARPSETRVVASTHRNLSRRVAEGWFRDELYYRLAVVPMKIPPLRERREDIGPLAEHFLRKACLLNHFEIKRLDSSAKQLLSRQSWPGNVRQLQNLMERLAILLPEERVTAADLDQLTSPGAEVHSHEGWFAKLMSLSELEKEYIQFVLNQTHGRKEEAARILGINRRTLYRKEREYDLIPSEPLQNPKPFKKS